MKDCALIIVDVQNDFCEGGALAVPGGNEVAERIAEYVRKVGENYSLILYTADWHDAPPADNAGHFGNPPDFVDSWPAHCVKNTRGAAFHDAIGNLPKFHNEDIFRKGQGSAGYSGFTGFNADGDSLTEFLKEHEIKYLDIVGLAGDYCVRQTALDGVSRGFIVTVHPNLVASIGGREATEETLRLVENASYS